MTTKKRLARLERLAQTHGPQVAKCLFPMPCGAHREYTAYLQGREHIFTTEAEMFDFLEERGANIGMYMPHPLSDEEWEAAAQQEWDTSQNA